MREGWVTVVMRNRFGSACIPSSTLKSLDASGSGRASMFRIPAAQD